MNNEDLAAPIFGLFIIILCMIGFLYFISTDIPLDQHPMPEENSMLDVYNGDLGYGYVQVKEIHCAIIHETLRDEKIIIHENRVYELCEKNDGEYWHDEALLYIKDFFGDKKECDSVR